MAVIVYNVLDEDKFGNNVYLIHRPYILSNPYTHINDKQTKAMFVVPTKEEAIERYSHYYDVMYGKNIEFTKIIDEIYAKYRRGEDIYLGCYCAPEPCHGNIIARKLQARMIKEKVAEAKKMKKDLQLSK
jgi:hypothetical protein